MKVKTMGKLVFYYVLCVRFIVWTLENMSPKTGSVLMTRTAEREGLPHWVMSSWVWAQFQQTLLCSRESVRELEHPA